MSARDDTREALNRDIVHAIVRAVAAAEGGLDAQALVRVAVDTAHEYVPEMLETPEVLTKAREGVEALTAARWFERRGDRVVLSSVGQSLAAELLEADERARAASRADFICDFCSQPGVVTTYSCRSFKASEWHESIGPWTACAACTPIVEVGDIAALAAHVLARQGIVGAQPAHDALCVLYRSFYANRGHGRPATHEDFARGRAARAPETPIGNVRHGVIRKGRGL